MLDYKSVIHDLLKEIDVTLPEIRLTTKKRGFSGHISPSGLGRWTTKKFLTLQAAYFFDPNLMFELGLIDYEGKEKLDKEHEFDVGGYLNCFIGTLTHAFILPEMERRLREVGYNFIVELPVYSHETGVYGTCDGVLFDDDNKELHLMDLKTTGPGIVYKNDVIETPHECQLYAYGKTLEDMYGYKVASISLVSVCKAVNSRCWFPTRDGELVKPKGEMHNPEDYTWLKYKMPVAAQYDVDWSSVVKKRAEYLKDVKSEVMKINGLIKKSYPSYGNWLTEGTEPADYKEKYSEVEKRLHGY